MTPVRTTGCRETAGAGPELGGRRTSQQGVGNRLGSEGKPNTPLQPLYASDKVKLCLLPINPALLWDRTAAPRYLPLQSCWCPQVPFAATSPRLSAALAPPRMPGRYPGQQALNPLAGFWPGSQEKGPESESLGSGRGWKRSCRCWEREGGELDGRCGYVISTVELLRTYALLSLKDDRPPTPME